MGKQTRNTLKEYFETGQKPVGANYVDLLDSYLLVDGENTGSINIQGSITASGNISASGIIYADTFQSHGSTEIGVSDSLNVTGGITASNITSSGFISASHFSGDGSGLTNVTASSLSIQQITASYLSGSIQASGSLDYTSGSTSILYAIQASGSIIPDSSSTWDLGGPNHVWKDLSINNISASGTITSFSASLNHLNVDSTLIVDSLIITGSNTFTNWGNFKNRMPVNNRFFTVTTDPTAPGGWREYNGVPGGTTGSAPHLHFQMSGSGQVGIGLLNPQATLHISESSNDFGALYIQGNVTASGNISASGTVSMLTATIGGGIFTSSSLAGSSVGNLQSMTTTTTVPINTNLILYGPITIGTSGILDIAVNSQVLVKDFLNA